MKKFLILLMVFQQGIFTMLNAQYLLDWMQPSGMFNKISVMAVADRNDNLVLTGYFQADNIYTRKYDLAGNFLWETTDSSGISGKYEKPLWISCDFGNNIYVVGKRYSISSNLEYPDAVLAIKYDPSGMLLWKQVIPVSVLIGSSFPDFRIRCEVDSTGNLFIGTVAAVPSGFVFYRIDPAGNLLFSQNNNANGVNGFGSMRLKGDKVVMTGSSGLFGNAPVVVWDTAGTLLWAGAGTGQSGSDVEMDDDSNVYLLTSFPNQVNATSQQDIVVIKYDATGNLLWKKEYDFGGSDFPTRFVLVAGRLSAICWGTVSATGSPYFDWKTFQTDTAGILIWNTVFDQSAYNDEYPYFLAARPDGEVVVTGIAGPSPFPSQSLSYLQLVNVAYDGSGFTTWVDTPNVYGGAGIACMFASDSSLFTVSYYNMTAYHYNRMLTGEPSLSSTEPKDMYAYPNPSGESVELVLGHSVKEYLTVELFNMTGRLERSFRFGPSRSGETRFPLDLSGLGNGLLLCKIQTDGKTVHLKVIKTQ